MRGREARKTKRGERGVRTKIKVKIAKNIKTKGKSTLVTAEINEGRENEWFNKSEN